MTMSDESRQTDLFQMELELMSLQEDSPVRTSPLLEIKKELMRNAVDCGQSVPVYLGTFDPDMPSLKTSQTCLLETGEIGLSEFYGTFPRSGTMRNGTVYQLPRLAPTTTEIGSGLWPTPDVRGFTNDGSLELLGKKAASWEEMSGMAYRKGNKQKKKFWRTPASANGSQGPKSKEFYEHYRKTGQSTITLVDEVRPTPSYLPTPTAVEYGRNKSLGPNAKERHSLSSMARHNLWPTPNASDNRDRGCMEDEAIKRRIRIGKQVGLSTAVKETRQSGTLNPTWVEWLMGFPLGHTDLDA